MSRAVGEEPVVVESVEDEGEEMGEMQVVKGKRGHGAMTLEAARTKGLRSDPNSPANRKGPSKNMWDDLNAEPEVIESPTSGEPRRRRVGDAARAGDGGATKGASDPGVEKAKAIFERTQKAAKDRAGKGTAKGPKGARADHVEKATKKAAVKKKKPTKCDLDELNYDKDLRERFLGCLSVVLALLLWGVPSVAYVARQPHDLSLGRYHSVYPKPALLEIVRPAPEQLATDSGLEWVFATDLTERCASSGIEVNVYLDRGLILHGADGKIDLPPASRVPETGAIDPFRLTFDMGYLQMGIHNVTVVMTSREKPPRFDPIQNTSLFVSTTSGTPPPPKDQEAPPAAAAQTSVRDP